MIRTVLVDDEPPASRKLRRLLALEPDFPIVGEAESAAAAIETIERVQPDLVFLDIGLPDATGFDVVEGLSDKNLHIVFVTAYDDFALKAFDVHALDYLLKPVEPSRFSAALARIRRIAQSGSTHELASRLDELVRSRNYASRLLVEENKRLVFVEVNRIDWIESARNYACLHTGTQTHILRSTLDALAAKLDPKIFRRISRSEIVNLRRVAEVSPWSHGDARIRLFDGAELTWTRRYRPESFEELERV